MNDNAENYCKGDHVSSVCGISKKELQGLVAAGVVPKEGLDTYHPTRAIKAYIEFLKSDKNGCVSQQEVADHLFLSVRKTREWLQKLGLDHKSSTLDQIRFSYIDNMRKAASGHGVVGGGGDDEKYDLIKERVLSERLDREIKLITLKEKSGEVVRAEEVLPMWNEMVVSARTELLSLADKLKSDIDAVHGIDVDYELLNDHIANALERLSAYEPDAEEINAFSGEEVQATTENIDD